MSLCSWDTDQWMGVDRRIGAVRSCQLDPLPRLRRMAGRTEHVTCISDTPRLHESEGQVLTLDLKLLGESGNRTAESFEHATTMYVCT